ncbi:methionine synthase [Desulfotalea psychrophila]|uniref:methionine synthase n=1 Tax=Desulfotalea psychrophila (strain LSv54 / DSM 12343) TaxID=177439 RepID=Q6AL44_DESPS|nr:dihydropteroate synthase [Desulfotalea psychrophila]CAG36931.1 related to 5-methyltetrahydrofolate--homocysteine methyltransferase [Desulfotalea psychrophila LSv54]
MKVTEQNRVPAQVSSLFQAVDIHQQIPPLIVGERANPTGSKKFRELLLAEDFEGCLQVAKDQEELGAHVLDVCAAWAGRDEVTDITRLIKDYSGTLKTPLMIDSTNPRAIKAALEVYPGRPIINSINLEDGGKTLHEVLTLTKKYGATVIALTIDESGMALSCDEKISIAKRIHHIATTEYGLDSSDLFFDPLTFTVGSGDKTLKDAAVQTMDAIKRIKVELPNCHTILGLSNISFGLPPAARKVLNAVFLHEAVAIGLDAVIINPTNCIPLDSIDKRARELALDLLYNREVEGESEPLMRYIEYFAENAAVGDQEGSPEELLSPEEGIRKAILKGSREGLEDTMQILLDQYTPLDIINQLLVPSMREVGELFGAGEMLLPFVLKSAEIMRASVDILEPYMEKAANSESTKILLATVQGDVHDIGKNLVNIILSNNGYQVIDIGIKASIESIIEAAKRHEVDMICLSGLLVKSAIVMQESMPIYREAGLTQPILLGGAALTKKFVAEACAPNYPSPVVYCQDAFSGLAAIQQHEAGTLETTKWQARETQEVKEAKTITILPARDIPTPPLGRAELSVATSDFLDLVKTNTLFRGRWGYRQNKMSNDEYAQLISTEVMPQFENIRRRILEEELFQAKIRYGWFRCYRQGDSLTVLDGEREYNFPLPRQKHGPHLCLADYFRDKNGGGDVVGFFVCTIGKKVAQALQQLYSTESYHDYFLLHGLSVNAAEALAEHAHLWMRQQMGSQFGGKRYSFGYSACPDLDLQRPLFELLQAEKIGITLSEELQMVPEQSVSAMVVHHDQASYFVV